MRVLVGELGVAVDIGRHFDTLGVAWLIGGSVASSMLGEPRATADVDVVADLRAQHVEPLYAALVETYYIDHDATLYAVRTRGTFNVIHLESMTKVDIYCMKDDEVSREEMARRIYREALGATLPYASAEDIILQKLRWFADGGGVSDRQWRDALGVLRVWHGKLDQAYLERTASALGVRDLLAKLSAQREPDQ